MKPMMNDEGILECPLCQSTISHVEKVYPAHSIAGWIVECHECGCTTGKHATKNGAIDSWNTRNGHLYTADDYKQDAMERANGL